MTQDTPGDDVTSPSVPDGSGPEHATPEPGQDAPDESRPAEGEELAADQGHETPSPEVFPFEELGPTPDRAIVAALNRLGEKLTDRFELVENLLRREARAEAAREKVIDRLHAELQEYKQDLLLTTLRPVFIDLIQLHDDIGKVAVTQPGPAGDGDGGGDAGHVEAKRLVALMDGFQQGIEDILYRQGVEPFLVEGDTFDPRRQRAIATVPGDDPALNKTVAARHRKGFRAGDRVIRPEIVSVYAVKK